MDFPAIRTDRKQPNARRNVENILYNYTHVNYHLILINQD